MNTPASPLRTALTFMGLALLPTALAVWGMSRKALWYDEITTAIYAAKSPGELWRYLAANDAHPPLFFMFEKLAAFLPLDPEFSLRLIPLLGYLLAAAAAEAIVREAYGVRWWGAILTLTFPGLAIYAQEARAYAPLCALEAWAVWSLLRMKRNPADARPAGLLVALLWLAAATSYLAIVFLLPLFLSALYVSKARLKLLAAATAGAVLYAPWLPRVAATFFGNGAALRNAAPRMVSAGEYAQIFSALWGGPWLAGATALAGLTALLAARRSGAAKIVLALAVFVPLFFTLIPPRYPNFPPRYLLPWAFLPIVVLAGLPATTGRPRIAGLVLALLCMTAAARAADSGLQRRSWNRDVAERFTGNGESGRNGANGDILLVSPSWALDSVLYYAKLHKAQKAGVLADPLRIPPPVVSRRGNTAIAIAVAETLREIPRDFPAGGSLWVVHYGPLRGNERDWKRQLSTEFEVVEEWPEAKLYQRSLPLETLP